MATDVSCFKLVWDKVQTMIANVGVQQSQSADLLNNLLNSQIEQYGADIVLYSIAQASEDFYQLVKL